MTTSMDIQDDSLAEQLEVERCDAKSAATLKGILAGVTFDRKLSDSEIQLLSSWFRERPMHGRLRELCDVLSGILADGSLSEDDHERILETIEDCIEYGKDPGVIDDRIDYIMGFLRGISADGNVGLEECARLKTLLSANPQMRDVFPASLLFEWLDSMPEGSVSNGNLAESFASVCRMVGANFVEDGFDPGMQRIVFDDEVPPQAAGKKVCFVGLFLSSRRRILEERAAKSGWEVHKSIEEEPDIVVVGDYSDKSWTNMDVGRKIHEAIALKKRGHPVRIVSESKWIKAVGE